MNTFARVASSDVSDTVRIKVISGFALTVSHATTKLIRAQEALDGLEFHRRQPENFFGESK